MKLKLWHLILQKIVKVSSGQKNQTCCQMYMKKFFLSLPITFSVLVNVIPYQIFIQNTQITVFKKNSTKSGALPLLQECPRRLGCFTNTLKKKEKRSTPARTQVYVLLAFFFVFFLFCWRRGGAPTNQLEAKVCTFSPF